MDRGSVEAYVDRADEVLGAHHDVHQEDAKENGHDPGTNKALDGLLGRQLNELGATESDTANVSPDIVGDDEGGRQEEPDHAFEDVVHDEVGLDDDKVQCHVRPSKVGELELVVAGLQRGDEEDESWIQVSTIFHDQQFNQKIVDAPKT